VPIAQRRLEVIEDEPSCSEQDLEEAETENEASPIDEEQETHVEACFQDPFHAVTNQIQRDLIHNKVRANQQQANVRAVKGYAQRHSIEVFEIGTKISIAISKLDRTPTDPKRVFGVVKGVNPLNKDLYSITTQYGLLELFYPTSCLNRLPDSIEIDLSKNQDKKVKLSYVAKQESKAQQVPVCCSCKRGCKNARCRCKKFLQKCSIVCHKDDYDCGNLSPLSTRTQMGLVATDELGPASGNDEAIPIEISDYESPVSSYYSDDAEIVQEQAFLPASSPLAPSPPAPLDPPPRRSTRESRAPSRYRARYDSEEQRKEDELVEQELVRLEASGGTMAPLWSERPEFAGMTSATRAFEKGRELRSRKAKGVLFSAPQQHYYTLN